MRLAWDLGISVLDSSVGDTEVSTSFCFHKIGYPVKNLFEGMIEFFYDQVAPHSNSFQEASYIHTFPDHALSGGYFTSFRMVWDPGIIFICSLAHSME
jgi:hypothetical protein